MRRTVKITLTIYASDHEDCTLDADLKTMVYTREELAEGLARRVRQEIMGSVPEGLRYKARCEVGEVA
jgi:hypothetical protein